MKPYIIILIVIIGYFLIISVAGGIFEFFGGVKYIHEPEIKKEMLAESKERIKAGYIIQGFYHDGWSMSMYPSTNRTWFYPKIYDFFYKWSVYYRFKWFDRC